jgi:peptidoglycan hydrolase CwlO-like protein
MSERSLERWMHQLPCGSRARKDYEALKAENKEIQHSLDCMVEATWELQEERNFLKQDCDRLRKELDEANGVIR